MKKILILFLLFFLAGCEMIQIKDNLFVSSIGLDYKDDENIVYLYTVQTDVISNDESKTSAIAKKSGSRIIDVLFELQRSLELEITYDQLKSVILSKDFIANGDVDEFINLFAFGQIFPINFYLFTTDDVEKVYNITNPDDSSTEKSLLTNPISNLTNELYKKPVSFIKFARDYYEEYKTNSLPDLKVHSDVWLNNVTINIGGVCYLEDELYCYDENELKGLGYIHDRNNFVITIDETDFLITELEYKLTHEDNYIVNLDVKYRHLTNYDKKKNYIDKINFYFISEISLAVETLFKDNIDVLEFKDYAYRRNRLPFLNDFKTEKWTFRTKITLV